MKLEKDIVSEEILTGARVATPRPQNNWTAARPFIGSGFSDGTRSVASAR
jgi:hypothetical protein